MDITAYELAQAIRVALVFGDEASALRLATELIAHHENGVNDEYADYLSRNADANDLTCVTTPVYTSTRSTN